MKLKELEARQHWSLDQKIDHSLGVIDQFISKLHGQVYVSFSGGKDSTVLLDLCRIIKPDIKAVFCNTGNEYPEIVRFVSMLRHTEGYNIDVVHPSTSLVKIFEEFGFPLISKQVAHTLYRAKYGYTVNNEMIPDKWMFLKNEKFDISDICCQKLKKDPLNKYQQTFKLSPIVGTMACESNMRRATYLKQGTCNVFDKWGRNKSKPLSIWMEDDIWKYISKRGLPIAEIYHKGLDRTGCMVCGFGCHMKNDTRLHVCYRLYPKVYNHFLNYKNHGVTYREALRKVLYINEMNLPDEKPVNKIEDCFLSIQDSLFN